MRHPKHLSLKNYSPIPSPGPPNSPVNTPITKQAKELGELYPTREAMLARSTSFNNAGLTTNEFYNQFERLFPEKNGPAYI